MSIQIKLNKETLESLEGEKNKLHFVPAQIDGNGETDVENNFENYTMEKGKVLKNSLRGYPMTGVECTVPEGYRGIVVTEANKPIQDDVKRDFFVQNTFDKFTYWNYDRDPSANDRYEQAMSWIDISQALHTPIVKEIDENV